MERFRRRIYAKIIAHAPRFVNRDLKNNSSGAKSSRKQAKNAPAFKQRSPVEYPRGIVSREKIFFDFELFLSVFYTHKDEEKMWGDVVFIAKILYATGITKIFELFTQILIYV